MKELLLLLATYPYDSSKRKTLGGLLGAVPDWTSFVRLINAHGIIALAAYNIKEAGMESMVPEQAMAMLENGLRQSIVRNAWLAERWKEMNCILLSKGIKHILLKGMALEPTIYGAQGLRQMTDNDILIPSAQAREAWDLLTQHGFCQAELKSKLHRKILFSMGKHLPALTRDGYAVEIHTEKYTDDAGKIIFPQDIMNYTLEMTIGGISADCLRKDIHLEFLISHFLHHSSAGECQMRSFNDIRLLKPNPDIEFPESFVNEPVQINNLKYRREHYKTTLKSVPANHRIRFLLGDIFPSLRWMRKRYGCSTALALLRYPVRMGKLLWLV